MLQQQQQQLQQQQQQLLKGAEEEDILELCVKVADVVVVEHVEGKYFKILFIKQKYYYYNTSNILYKL
jgi:hypothetical protein